MTTVIRILVDPKSNLGKELETALINLGFSYHGLYSGIYRDSFNIRLDDKSYGYGDWVNRRPWSSTNYTLNDDYSLQKAE